MYHDSIFSAKFIVVFWSLQLYFAALVTNQLHNSYQSTMKLLLFFFYLIQSHLSCPYQQAAKSKEPIRTFVTLMDGRTVSVELESASTSAEVCQAVAAMIGLKDTYGFSLYINFQDKVIFTYKIKNELVV